MHSCSHALISSITIYNFVLSKAYCNHSNSARSRDTRNTRMPEDAPQISPHQRPAAAHPSQLCDGPSRPAHIQVAQLPVLERIHGSPAIPRVGTKLVPIGPQRLGLFGRLYRPLRNTKYGRLLLELTLGCLVWAGLQHPGPLRGPPTAGPTLAMTNLPYSVGPY